MIIRWCLQMVFLTVVFFTGNILLNAKAYAQGATIQGETQENILPNKSAPNKSVLSIMDTPFAENIKTQVQDASGVPTTIQLTSVTPASSLDNIAVDSTKVDSTKKSSLQEVTVREEKAVQNLYGDWPASLFFSKDETILLKKAMDFYALGGNNTAQEVFANVSAPDTPLAPKMAHLLSVKMPVFNLHSLVYNNPRSWTAWVGKSVFSSDLEDETDEDLQVVSVGHDFVTFLWKPKNDVFAMLSVNEKLKSEADETKNDKFENRRAVQIVAPPKLDDKLQTVTFGLRINQVFYPDKMLITEGKLAEEKTIAKPNEKPTNAKNNRASPKDSHSAEPPVAGNHGTISILKDMPNIK